MQNRIMKTALAGLLAPALAVPGAWALAQGQKQQQQSQQQQAEKPQRGLPKWDTSSLYRNTWSADEMLDTEVRGENGEDIGDVKDIIVGADGTISKVVVEVGGFLEIGDQHIGVPWKDVQIGPAMRWIQVPLREVESGTYSLHGRTPQGEDVAAAHDSWRVNELIGDYASLEDVPRYGLIADVIFTDNGKAQGLIVERGAGAWGGRGWYAYPYAGFYPGAYSYPLPYRRAEVGDYGRFDYVQLGEQSGYSDAQNKRKPRQQAQSSGGKAQGASAGSSQQRTTLAVAKSAEHGRYVADASGRAVYLLEADKKGESTCYDACASLWPPLKAGAANPLAGDPALHDDLLGTLKRRDGSMQVTYNGHPLYYYAKDAGPGKATGHDVHDQWGEWYLVSPQGSKLEEGGAAAGATTGKQQGDVPSWEEMSRRTYDARTPGTQ